MPYDRKPIVSDRCEPPTQEMVAAMRKALDEIMEPAIQAAFKALNGSAHLTMDLLLTAYINLGVRVEGAAAFAETLAEIQRTVAPTLAGIEADAQAAGRA